MCCLIHCLYFFLSGLIAARQGSAYSPSRHKCQTENCEYYGDKKFHGYCSNCYQGNSPDNSQNVLLIHLIILSLCVHWDDQPTFLCCILMHLFLHVCRPVIAISQRVQSLIHVYILHTVCDYVFMYQHHPITDLQCNLTAF